VIACARAKPRRQEVPGGRSRRPQRHKCCRRTEKSHAATGFFRVFPGVRRPTRGGLAVNATSSSRVRSRRCDPGAPPNKCMGFYTRTDQDRRDLKELLRSGAMPSAPGAGLFAPQWPPGGRDFRATDGIVLASSASDFPRRGPAIIEKLPRYAPSIWTACSQPAGIRSSPLKSLPRVRILRRPMRAVSLKSGQTRIHHTRIPPRYGYCYRTNAACSVPSCRLAPVNRAARRAFINIAMSCKVWYQYR
jgi:hypothetical protein